MVTANPNPSNYSFTVKVNGPQRTGAIILKVINISRHTIETRRINSTQICKIRENYRPGIYFVELTQGTQRRTVKVIKQ